jgi:copper(I)-binding protein
MIALWSRAARTNSSARHGIDFAHAQRHERRIRGMRRRILAAAVVGALTLTVGAVAQQDEAGPKIEHPWARATPGGAKTAAAYLTIEGGASPDRLLAVSTPVAGKAELHSTTNEGGVMKMHAVGGIDVPARQPVELKPGAYHVMLMELKHPLKEGESFPLTLTFEKAGERKVTVAVEKAGAMGKMGGK